MSRIQSDLVKAIEFISLTEQEEKEAIFEGKKKKYFHQKNAERFQERYNDPDYTCKSDAEVTVEMIKKRN